MELIMKIKYFFGLYLLAILVSSCGGGSSSSNNNAATTSSTSSTSSVTLSSSSTSTSSAMSVATGACAGNYIFCDDFDNATLDNNKWKAGNTNIARKYAVRPDNVSLITYNDNGTTISVVDTAIYGDLHPNVTQRQGGLIITKQEFSGGRYEIRMKNLPGPNGCSCIWNYYDSDNEDVPPTPRVYTEIDIEMPSHPKTPPTWSDWQKTFAFNTWSHTDADSDATWIIHSSTTVNAFDGGFHVFRWDWYDGSNGNMRIDWYVDNILQATTNQHVSNHPAQLWVGNFPAPWVGLDYNYDTLHLYIDWVRISTL